MADLTKPLDTTSNKANLLFNKYLGYAYSGDPLGIGSEFPTSAIPKIPKNLIMADDIPQSAPTLNSAQNVNYWYKLYERPTNRSNTDNVPEQLSYKLYTPTDTTIKVVKYENVKLFGFTTIPDRAFYFRRLRDNTSASPPVDDDIFDSENILKDAISSNFDSITNTYKITVQYYDINSTDPDIENRWKDVPINKYVFDRDAGLITFYDFIQNVNQSNPPRISFWRYVGNFGTISNVTTAVFSINGQGDAYLKDKRVAIGKDTVNAGYTFDISGNLNVDGNITQNGVPITGVLDDNIKYDFKQLPMAPKIDNQGLYSTTERDDYTSAIHKIDNWVYKYMLSQPDAIDTSGTRAAAISAGGELIFYWENNPQQYKFGFSDKKLPAINKIHAEVDISGNGVAPDYYPFGIDGSGLYVPGVNEINALVLSKVPGNPPGTGRKEQRTITVAGVSKTVDAFVYYNTSLENAANDILITIWYSNNAEQLPNKMTQYNLGKFLSLFPPTAVTANTPTVGQNTINTSWTAPQFGSTTDEAGLNGLLAVNPNPIIENYRVSYTPESSKKYGGTSSVQSITPTVVSGTQTSASTNQAPGATTYKATIEAKNTANPLYNNDNSLLTKFGVDVTGIVVPDPPATNLNMISSSGVTFSTYAGTGIESDTIYPVIANPSVAIPRNMITYAGDATKNSSAITNIAVLNATNIGTGAKAEITDNENHKTTLNAYPTLNAVHDPTNGGAISNANIEDPYANTINDKLYLRASYTYKLYTSGKANANKHTIQYTQKLYDADGTTVTASTPMSIDYYVDSLPTNSFATVYGATIETPTLTDTGSTIVKTLCGITALSPATSKNTITLNTYDINTTDIGRYYYNGTKVIKVAPTTAGVTGTVVGTLQAANPRDNTNSAITLDGTELPQLIKLYTSSSKLSVPLTLNTGIAYGKQLQLTYIPNNLNKENGAGSHTETLSIIIDPSLRNNELTSPVNIVTTGSHNYKQTVRNHISSLPVEKDTTVTPNISANLGTITSFSNTESLVGNYINELLYADGAYRFKESVQQYLIKYNDYIGNTFDYTDISGNTHDRYALFTFKVPKTTTNNLSSLSILIEGLNEQIVKTSTDNLRLSSETPANEPSAQIAIMYRFDIEGDTGRSTVWLKAFENGASTTSTNRNNIDNNMTLGGFMGSLTNTLVSGKYNVSFNVHSLSMIPNTTLANDINIHVLVKVSHTATNLTFKDIKCSYLAI